jgi:hypothetical protein
VVEWQRDCQLQCPLHQPAVLVHAHDVQVHPTSYDSRWRVHFACCAMPIAGMPSLLD